MGSTVRLAALAAGTLTLVAASWAAAEPMDPALERLVLDDRCRTPTGAIVDDQATMDLVLQATGRETCSPDHVAFKKLMSQYAFALAPTAMHSARTTGFGGFHFSLEAAYTSIDDDATYWRQGTQGSVDPSSGRASIRNTSPAALLSVYSAKIRKSFGFGLELTGAVGFMPKTNIISGGADARLSLLEGFRTGAAGILPDIAVGGGVRTITGTPQFQMTVVGLDVQISKPLPIADSSIITPWVGFQYLWTFADSGLIDLTPGTDAISYCNFSGPNVPGPNNSSNEYNGQPVCNGGHPRDFNNNVVFNKVRLERQRLMFGANYRYEMVMLGAQFITDIVDPADAQNSDADKADLANEDRQWTVVVELGAMF